MISRDLKTILESENHDVETVFCDIPFTISTDRNIYNAIRIKYRDLALEAQTKFGEIYGQFEDINDLLDSATGAFVYCIENALLEIIQDIISVDIYTIDKGAIIEEAFDSKYFGAFEKTYKKISNRYAEIISDLNDAEYARELRKESRGRWQSATFGGSAISAWSNQLETTAMNAVEGIGYSIVNAIGNAFSRSEANRKIKNLFESKSLRQEMICSVYYSCFNLHNLLIDLVNQNTRYNIGGRISSSDSQKAQAMFNNLMTISLTPEKRDIFITQIFQLNPYDDEYYTKLIQAMGDKDNSIGKFSEFFGVNIFAIKNDILVDYVNKNIGETEESALKCKSDMVAKAAEIGLDLMEIVQASNILNERLNYFDEQYRTVEDIVFDTREEADLARVEKEALDSLRNSIHEAPQPLTLSYEKELLSIKTQMEAYKTKIKEKYIKEIDELLEEFDKTFRQVDKFGDTSTREEAANRRALEYATSIPTLSFEELDEAYNKLEAFLPELGITKELSDGAFEFLDKREEALRNVDGVQFQSREEAMIGYEELVKIQEIMANVAPPNKDCLLPYEERLTGIKENLSAFSTPIKDKYIGMVEQNIAAFDTTFRTVNSVLYSTREEAAAQRTYNLAKKIIPKKFTEQDLINAREEVDKFLPLVGISFEQAETTVEYFRQCYLVVNTVDGIPFNSKEEAEEARAELAEITAIMSQVQKPDPHSLLDYEQGLFEVKAKLESYKTPIKNKYIAIIDDYIAKFDVTFKQTGLFQKVETREQAAQIRALNLVRSIAVPPCGYAEVDNAIQALNDTLPKLGIDISQAIDATQYIQSQENRLNTVDGVVLSSREEAALARQELTDIQNIMFKVAPPTNEPLLSYEKNLLDIQDKLSVYQTPIKNKYIGIIKKHLVDFDEKFRKVSLIKTAATREEAAKERALKFVKSKQYNTITDVENARNELNNLLPELGITMEQATEAAAHLVNVENKLNGIAPESKLKGMFGKFMK